MGQLGVGGVLGGKGRGRKGGERGETYCNGVSTRAVVGVVVVSGSRARGVSVVVDVDRVAGEVFWRKRLAWWGGKEKKDALERPFDLGTDRGSFPFAG